MYPHGGVRVWGGLAQPATQPCQQQNYRHEQHQQDKGCHRSSKGPAGVDSFPKEARDDHQYNKGDRVSLRRRASFASICLRQGRLMLTRSAI